MVSLRGVAPAQLAVALLAAALYDLLERLDLLLRAAPRLLRGRVGAGGRVEAPVQGKAHTCESSQACLAYSVASPSLIPTPLRTASLAPA